MQYVQESSIPSDQDFPGLLGGFQKVNSSQGENQGGLRKDQLHTLIEFVKSTIPPQIATHLVAAYLIGYYCLFRISEVLQIKQLVFKEGGVMEFTIDFPTKTECGRVSRDISLPQEVYQFLKGYFSGQGIKPFFRKLGRELPNKTIQACFANKPGFWSFHSLRHGRARDLYCVIPLERVMFFGRWRSKQSALIYLGHVPR